MTRTHSVPGGVISRHRRVFVYLSSGLLMAVLAVGGAFFLPSRFGVHAAPARAMHCVVTLPALHLAKGQTLTKATTLAAEAAAPTPHLNCSYPTFAAAISAATNGRVNLPASATQQQVWSAATASVVRPSAAAVTVATNPNTLGGNVAAVFYWNINFGGSQLVVSGGAPCGGSTFYQWNYVGNAWNDQISSAQSNANFNCPVISEWADADYGNAEQQVDGGWQPWIGSVMNDQTSSFRLTYSCDPDCVH